MRPLIEDVESRMKVRKCSLVPLTITTSALAELGRTDATTAILKALNKLVRTITATLRAATHAQSAPCLVCAAKEVAAGD